MAPILDVSYLPNLMTRVLDVALDCLEETPLGRPTVSGLYHTAPPADCCDGLFVWLERIYPAKGFPAQYSGAINCGEIVPVAAVAIRLYRGCWPVLKDSAVDPTPPAADSDLAAANLQMDAVKLFCCLLGDLSNTDGTILGGACLKATMGAIEPGAPQGGCTSWTVRFNVELDSCCI